jgi:hypothetical protein
LGIVEKIFPLMEPGLRLLCHELYELDRLIITRSFSGCSIPHCLVILYTFLLLVYCPGSYWMYFIASLR